MQYCLLCVHTVCAVSYFYFHQFLVCIRYVGRRGNSHNIVRVFNSFFSSLVFSLSSCFGFFVFSRLLLHLFSFLSAACLLSRTRPIQSNRSTNGPVCVYVVLKLSVAFFFLSLNFYYYFFLSFDSFAPLS